MRNDFWIKYRVIGRFEKSRFYGILKETSLKYLLSSFFIFRCSLIELIALPILTYLANFSLLANTRLVRVTLILRLKSFLCDATMDKKCAHKIRPIRFVWKVSCFERAQRFEFVNGRHFGSAHTKTLGTRLKLA